MADFIYEKTFQHGEDTTKYRLLTKDYVSVSSFEGREILKIDPKGLELLAKEAVADVSFFLRESHLKQVASILKNPEASDNDKFVAFAMLRNSVVAAEGKLPWCQDTGTSVVIAQKGENVFTGVDDAMYLSKGIYETFQQKNLRYSQVVPIKMFDEHNSANNLPAQIDIHSVEGNSYEFLFIQKGGGSANKTFLYQQTKALLNEEALFSFVKEKIKDIGTSACPPYHLAVVVGGLSAEMTLKSVKEASAGILDDLPLSGNESGRAFRDVEWEARIAEICRECGYGAQYGGTAFAHDVKVIRLPRHAASCPVGIGVSCSADRNVKAKITADGIFLEKLEHNPQRFLPKEQMSVGEVVDVDLDRPMDEIRAQLSKYPVMTRLSLTGTLIVARDMAHARIKKMIDSGEPMPEYLKKHPVYYAGPAKKPSDMASGSLGPTTAGRMDEYVKQFQSLGGSLIMIAKGGRSRAVTDSCAKYGGFYLGAIGGPAAIMAEENIKSAKTIAFEEYGMEAVREIKVENMSAFIVVDDKGNNFFDRL